jgi:hypothetical protein
MDSAPPFEKHLCRQCRTTFALTEPACPNCGRAACPAHTTWPAGAKRLISLLVLVDAVAEVHGEQVRWERLLSNSFKGRRYGDVMLEWAADPAAAYQVLEKAIEAWQAAGSPNDFDALLQIRNGIRIRTPLTRSA